VLPYLFFPYSECVSEKKRKKYVVGDGGAANNSQFSPLHTQFSKPVVFISFFAANHCNDRSL